MSDALALRSLVDRYAVAVDRRDTDALLALFTPGAEVVLPASLARELPSAELIGHEQIATLVDGVRNFRRTRHLVLQQVLDIHAGTATGETYCQAHHLHGEPPNLRDLVLELRYLDEYTRLDGHWLFARRELVLDWSSRHDVREPG